MSATILTTVSARGVDLLNPRASDVDFRDMAEQLAKENRFNGATPGVCYSVAQHLVGGALNLQSAGASREAIAAWLLHDCHEAYLKDDTTPKKRAIAAIAEKEFGVLAKVITGAFEALTERWDVAIHKAAGVAWPLADDVAKIVHETDRRMLVSEWFDLMRGPLPSAYAGIEPFQGRVIAWHWPVAARRLTDLFRKYLPALGGTE